MVFGRGLVCGFFGFACGLRVCCRLITAVEIGRLDNIDMVS